VQIPSATSAASGPTRISHGHASGELTATLVTIITSLDIQIKKQGRAKNQALARLGASFEIRKNDVDPGALLVPVIFKHSFFWESAQLVARSCAIGFLKLVNSQAVSFM